MARAGDALIGQKQKAKATALWQKALLEDPQNSTLQKKLGEVLMVQDRYKEASTAFESAIEVDSENTNAVLGQTVLSQQMRLIVLDFYIFN